MAELKVEVPDSMVEIAGEELKELGTQALFRGAIEEKLRALLLFKVVDGILKKSKLTGIKAKELAEELRFKVAKRHGLVGR